MSKLKKILIVAIPCVIIALLIASLGIGAGALAHIDRLNVQNNQHEHTMGEWETTTPATCTANGIKTKSCANCDYKEYEIIPAKEHSFGEWETVADGLCTVTTAKVRTCTNCDYKDYNVNVATVHSFGDWQTVSSNTCEKNVKRSCSKCEFEEFDTIKLADHNYVDGACTGCETPIYLTIIEGPSECAVAGYKGDSTDVVIPSTYNNKPVTIIGETAFYMSNITSVTIPDSIVDIHKNAFFACVNLNAVYITDLEKWCQIEFACEGLPSTPLFYAHNLYLNGELVVDLVIPDGVTKLNHAFAGGYFKSITLPASLTEVQVEDFITSYGIERITVEQGNPKYSSTGNCLIETATKELILGSKNSVIPTDGSVTSIGFMAFAFADIKSIYIPNTITFIGDFSIPAKLLDITYPGTMDEWINLRKDAQWDNLTYYCYTIHCTDGDLNQNDMR